MGVAEFGVGFVFIDGDLRIRVLTEGLIHFYFGFVVQYCVKSTSLRPYRRVRCSHGVAFP